jgi:hypothetical protein
MTSNECNFRDALDLFVEGEHGARHVRRRFFRIERDLIAVTGGFHLKHFPGNLIAAVSALDCPQRHARGEHREKAVRMREQRRAIGKRNQPKCEKLIAADAFAMFAPQPQHEPRDQRAEARADRETATHAPS